MEFTVCPSSSMPIAEAEEKQTVCGTTLESLPTGISIVDFDIVLTGDFILAEELEYRAAYVLPKNVHFTQGYIKYYVGGSEKRDRVWFL